MATFPELTTPEQDLWQAVTPRSDEVIAVFRNGKVIDIAAPGKRVRPLWYKTRPGNLTYARILRSEIQVKATLLGIPVRYPFVLPEVSISCLVALSPRNDYAVLRERLLARGLQFQVPLAAELNNSLDEVVRGVFAELTHEEIVSAPRAGGLWSRLVGVPLVRELFVVQSVDAVLPSSDPEYVRQRDSQVGAIVDVDVRRRDWLEQLGRDRIDAERAAVRGLSLTDYENPELVQQRLAQAHELAMHERQAALEAALAKEETARTELTVSGEVQRAKIENITQLTRAAQLGGPPIVAMTAAELPQRSDNPTLDAIALPLSRDPAVLQRWSEATGSGRKDVLGAIRVEQGQHRLVVLVLPPRACADGDWLEHSLADAFPDDEPIAIPATSSLDEWVGHLVRRRVPGVADQQATFRPQEQADDVLHLLVSSSADSRQIVGKIIDTDTLVVPALTQLLPYRDVVFLPS